jgi:hypothetical protein
MMNVRMLLRSFLLVVLFIALFGVTGYASTITFVHTGSGSGTLAGVPFGASTFTITGVGDTTTRTSFLNGFSIALSSVSINISGVGNLTIITPTRYFVNNANQTVGFSRGSGTDLFDGPSNSAFGVWDMTTSIGPISGTANLLQWTLSPNISTDQGILIFANGVSDSTFRATVTTSAPEASSVLLLGTGLTLLGFIKRSLAN